jgi:archaellum biogenesis ATPase FlaH
VISIHLKDCKFIKVKKNEKMPFTQFKGDDWNNKIISFEEANENLKDDWNVGIVAGNGFIIIDADKQESVDWCDANLPLTYTEETCSRGRHYVYSTKVPLENKLIGNDMGEVRCDRQFVVAAPSKAKSKITNQIEPYKVVRDVEVREINSDVIEKLLNHFSKLSLPINLSKLIQKNVDKKFLDVEVIAKLHPYIKDLVLDPKNPEQLKLFGFPSRSERDMKIVSYLLNKNFGEYIFSIFKLYGCGEKYREHNSGDKYLQKTIDEAIKFLGLRSKEDMDLELEIESNPIQWIKRHLDDYLIKINNIKDDNNLFKERLVATLAYRLKLKQQKLEKRIKEIVENNTPKETISLFELSNKEYKPTEFWLEPLIPKGTIIMLGSKPGEGKSLFVQGLMTSLLSTKSFLGYQTKEAPKILLYAIDDSSEHILHSRNTYILNYLQMEHNFNKEGLNNCKVTFQFNKNNLNKEIEDALQYDIIIIDSYRRVLTGTENDSDITDEFFNKFFKPLKEAGKTIIILHHVKKANLDEIGEDDLLYALRGSGDIAAQLDLAYILRTSQAQSGSPMIEYKDCIMSVCKNRLGLSFKDLNGNFTNNICYRVVKNVEKLSTHFEYIDPKVMKNPKERRQDIIVKVVKKFGTIKRTELLREVKKEVSSSDIQIFKDLDELVKSFIIMKQARGVYSTIEDEDTSVIDDNDLKDEYKKEKNGQQKL